MRPRVPAPVLWSLIGLCAACFVGFWFTPHTLGITDLDEGLYAAAAREMVLTGDWVTPRVNGEPFFEKPPLLYWLSATAIRAFGAREWAVRLPAAVAATLMVIATFAFGTRYLDRASATYGAVFLPLAPMTFAAGRLATTDAALALCVSCSLFAAYAALRPSKEPGDRRDRSRWALLAWGAAGLGVLAKGAPGVLLPLLTLVAYRLVVRRERVCGLLGNVVTLRTGLGVALFAVIVLPWHIAAWRANGGPFVEEYIVRQHVGRFRGGDTAHHAPPWFFVPGFLAGFFPWSVFAVAALRPDRAGGDHPHPEPDALAFLRTWVAVVFVAFSLGGSKLISYILPLYPGAALLAGHWLSSACARRQSRKLLAGGALAALAVAGLVSACLLWPEPAVGLVNRYADRVVRLAPADREMLRTAGYAVGAGCAGLLAFAALALSGRTRYAPASLAVGMAAFFIGILLWGVPIARDRMVGGLHSMAATAALEAGTSGIVAIAIRGPRRPSVLFYVPDRVLREHRLRELDPDDHGGWRAALSDVMSAQPARSLDSALLDADAVGAVGTTGYSSEPRGTTPSPALPRQGGGRNNWPSTAAMGGADPARAWAYRVVARNDRYAVVLVRSGRGG
ncbi:MAG: glycosyltransferase family 39 protein [Armatimonadetes bacterium]|nr:glycosyltransferase family 39 protein [Armatimonadota bacterium]